jgi:hypothetical protein
MGLNAGLSLIQVRVRASRQEPDLCIPLTWFRPRRSVLRYRCRRIRRTFTQSRVIPSMGSIRVYKLSILYPQLQAEQGGSQWFRDEQFTLDGEMRCDLFTWFLG